MVMQSALIHALIHHVWLSTKLNNLIAGPKTNKKTDRKKNRHKETANKKKSMGG